MNTWQLVEVLGFHKIESLSIVMFGGYGLISLSWFIYTIYSRNEILIILNALNLLSTIIVFISLVLQKGFVM